MRILILGNSAGGTYNFRGELVEALISRGHEVLLSVPDDDYVSLFESMGCRVIITEIDRRGMNPKSEQRLYRTYLKMVRSVKPDCILTYTIKPNIYGGLVAKRLGIPQIANVTGLGTAVENNDVKSKIVLSLYKRGLSGAQTVFFQNKANMKYFLDNNIVSGKCDVLSGSGVNLRKHPFEPYPPKTDEYVFLIIGRIMKDKGIDEVLAAVKTIKKEYPKVTFRFLGSFEDDYRDIIQEAHDRNEIEYCGVRPDVHSFIKNSHATINATYHEGMSNVLQETAAAGRPVLATNIPGCIETFEPNVSGISFKPKSSEDLVRAIKEFIALPYEKKAEMGAEGRKRMEKLFDRNIIVEKYLEQIEKDR